MKSPPFANLGTSVAYIYSIEKHDGYDDEYIVQYVDAKHISFYAGISHDAIPHRVITNNKLTGFNLKQIPLGCYTHDGVVYRASRMPSRQWKTGLSRNNSISSVVLDRNGANPGDYWTDTAGFHKMLSNVFPTFAAARRAVLNVKRYKQVALSKKWFITNDDELGYVRVKEPVGTWVDGFELLPEYVYLQQELEELNAK